VLAGPAYLRAYVGELGARLPHLAIGGVTPENVRELAAAGCRGVAVSGAVCAAQRPAEVCRALREGLGNPGSTGR
jgi:thiamine-phosphate pyrophosphorylase